MSCSKFRQDVLDKRIYAINFSNFLGSGVNIATTSWDTPSALTISDTGNDGTTATAYFSGGVEGEEYEVSCTATSNETIARKFTHTFLIEINDNCE